MSEVSRQEGRTVLFVSHNIASISDLTHRSLLLEVRAHCSDRSDGSGRLQLCLKRRHCGYLRPPTRPGYPALPILVVLRLSRPDLNGVHRFGEPMEVQILDQT